MKLQYCHETKKMYPLWSRFIRKQSLKQMNNSNHFAVVADTEGFHE